MGTDGSVSSYLVAHYREWSQSADHAVRTNVSQKVRALGLIVQLTAVTFLAASLGLELYSSKATPTGYVTTKPPLTASAAPQQPPENRYADPCPRMGNFGEHIWGISTSVISGGSEAL
ncbi:hypothetical protein H7H78_04705 [Mycobacterium shinjukuense]|uniref:hypothetical protein n=1 Tax=Mycobacterium shinjukuense TaxID=398694 RepID=UPI00114FE2CB|nr:hypothetical protein [Mycobacterium shinjukuense]MCV6984763.1 hypothetical protein [Mycobacterium shinjukuense]